MLLLRGISHGHVYNTTRRQWFQPGSLSSLPPLTSVLCLCQDHAKMLDSANHQSMALLGHTLLYSLTQSNMGPLTWVVFEAVF